MAQTYSFASAVAFGNIGFLSFCFSGTASLIFVRTDDRRMFLPRRGRTSSLLGFDRFVGIRLLRRIISLRCQESSGQGRLPPAVRAPLASGQALRKDLILAN